jgi:monovalent cation:proton antiporter
MKFTDVILQTATKILVFIILTYAVYVLFAGHHHPGGGFVGGLITAAAFVCLYIAFDAETVRNILPVDFKLLGALGVGIAVLTGCASVLFGVPFLTHTAVEAELPLLGKTHLASAVLFDIGVYFAVVGTAMTIITSISEDE